MKSFFFFGIVVHVSMLLVACNPSGKGSSDVESMPEDQRKEKQAEELLQDDPSATLSSFNLATAENSTYKLPSQLNEISGLTMTDEGKLFGHNDEQGVVYQIDQNDGTIIKRFTVGTYGLEEDFEGIEAVGDNIFLTTSGGTLFKFTEGADLGRVDFRQMKTPLTSKFDVEGLCFDPERNLLLLLCKEYPGKKYKKHDEKTVYGYSLETEELDLVPRFIIPAKKIAKRLDIRNFKPSGIEYNSSTGTYFVISSNAPAIVELSKEGRVLAASKLPKSSLQQPEGITFSKDGTMFIASEGARISRFNVVESR